MTRATSFLTLIPLAICVAQAARSAAIGGCPDGTGPMLAVRIYNYAEVGDAVLSEAAQAAGETFRRSGVDTRWTICALPGVESEVDEPCTERQSPDTLQIRIVGSAPRRQNVVRRIVFGFALPSKEGFGTVATAFWDRIAETADASKVTRPQLLASVMVHEAGHLLLGFNGHSGEGLMSGRWDEESFRKISQGALSFVGRQRSRIRIRVQERLAATCRIREITALARNPR